MTVYGRTNYINYYNKNVYYKLSLQQDKIVMNIIILVEEEEFKKKIIIIIPWYNRYRYSHQLTASSET
jgi:hypothetical protein